MVFVRALEKVFFCLVYKKFKYSALEIIHREMAPLRWGIAAAGKISNDFVASLATLSADQHQITAVAARNEQSAKEFAETFDINNYYGGYEKLAADANVGEYIN